MPRAMSTREYIPERTCIACRQVHPKRELVRLVATPQGEVTLDRTGRLPGRGAYLCPRLSCWEAALKGRKLSQALRTSFSQENQERLRREYMNLTGGAK
jgi:predicted RNA-binding protein YlxR (DUF448 family)